VSRGIGRPSARGGSHATDLGACWPRSCARSRALGAGRFMQGLAPSTPPGSAPATWRAPAPGPDGPLKPHACGKLACARRLGAVAAACDEPASELLRLMRLVAASKRPPPRDSPLLP
jgi:hypothetical protein